MEIPEDLKKGANCTLHSVFFDDPRYPKVGEFFWSQRYSFRFQTHDSFGM